MKLTREDIKKYGTKNEKNILKVNSLQRYALRQDDYGTGWDMEEYDNGSWVRYEDVIELFTK